MHISDGSFKNFDKIQKDKVSHDALEAIVQKELAKGAGAQLTPLPEPEGWRQTDSILIKTDGYWWIHSKVDHRWRAEGKGMVGGTDFCEEAKRAFWELKSKFGNPPWDVVYRIEPRDLKKFKLASDPDEIRKRSR